MTRAVASTSASASRRAIAPTRARFGARNGTWRSAVFAVALDNQHASTGFAVVQIASIARMRVARVRTDFDARRDRM